MPKILEKNKLSFISVESPSDYNLDDTYFINGIHPSEVFVAIQSLRYHSLFKNKIDTSKIQDQLEKRFNNIFFYKKEMIVVDSLQVRYCLRRKTINVIGN